VEHALDQHLAVLEALHREIDQRAAALAERHAGKLQCRLGCTECCTPDFTIFEIEAARIRHHHPELLATEAPHPPGKCALLSAEGACRVYADRPYICRTQGLPLCWLEELSSGDLAEHRDVCPLNLSDVSLLDLPREDFWRLGPYEQRLAELQQRAFGGSLRRVALRDLFAPGR
jgi:hypothetical protein